MRIISTLFKDGNLAVNVSKSYSSLAFPLFCESRKSLGYEGDDIDEFQTKLCNQFFQIPTDVGFCMTKNLDIKNLIKQSDMLEEYSDFMEIKEQKLDPTIFVGTSASTN